LISAIVGGSHFLSQKKLLAKKEKERDGRKAEEKSVSTVFAFVTVFYFLISLLIILLVYLFA
jgi:hypothetical protein